MSVFCDDKNWIYIRYYDPDRDESGIILVGRGEKYRDLAERKNARINKIGYTQWAKQRKKVRIINKIFMVLFWAGLVPAALFVHHNFNRLDIARCFLGVAAGFSWILIIDRMSDFFDKKLWP